MLQTLPNVALKNGEIVAVSVVLTPEKNWQAPIADLLHHKDGLSRWQIAQLVTGPCGIKARFYILHRESTPFCTTVTVEQKGIGILGHVWTNPEDRRQSAVSQLLQFLTQDFQERGGRALYLSTAYDGAPYHIYRANGFNSVEDIVLNFQRVTQLAVIPAKAGIRCVTPGSGFPPSRE